MSKFKARKRPQGPKVIRKPLRPVGAARLIQRWKGEGAVVAKFLDPFGTVLVFTDAESRDAHGKFIREFSDVGEFTVSIAPEGEGLEGEPEEVIVAWGRE